MSRLTIDISDQQHQRLKVLAALQGKSIKQYAIERLFADHPADEQAWQELKALLEHRISEGLAGGVSARSVDEIVEDEFRRTSR